MGLPSVDDSTHKCESLSMPDRLHHRGGEARKPSLLTRENTTSLHESGWKRFLVLIPRLGGPRRPVMKRKPCGFPSGSQTAILLSRWVAESSKAVDDSSYSFATRFHSQTACCWSGRQEADRLPRVSSRPTFMDKTQDHRKKQQEKGEDYENGR